MHLKCTNILAVAALTMVSVCSNAMADYEYAPLVERVERISLQDARRVIEAAAREHLVMFSTDRTTDCGFGSSYETRLNATRITFGPDFFELAEARDTKGRPLQSPVRFYYRDFPTVNLTYVTHPLAPDHADIHLTAKNSANLDKNIFRCSVIGRSPWFQEGAKNLADAFRRLQFEFERTGSPAAEAVFQQVVQGYLGANPKPEFPESARRSRVQAESALRDKRFDDAAERYTEALEVVPWWPEGRFNLALVLGELKAYDSAMREMKRYLQLAPNAPDARAAQDKIYEWEGYQPGKAR